MQTPAGNTSGSGIRAEREGNAFNLSLGGHLVHSLVSQEASRSCCCHLLATSKICCIFVGLKTKPSSVAFLLCFGANNIRFVHESCWWRPPWLFLMELLLLCGWTISPCSLPKRQCLMGSELGQCNPLFPSFPLFFLLPGVISTSTFSYGQVALQESWKVPFLAWASWNMPAVWEGGFCLSWAFANPFCSTLHLFCS